jgi:hypothetical protein
VIGGGAFISVAVLMTATLIVVAWKGLDTIPDFVTLRLNEMPSPGPDGGVGFAALTGLPQTTAYVGAFIITLLAVRYASLSLAIIAMLMTVSELHLHYLTWLLIPIVGIWLPGFITKAMFRSGRPAVLQDSLLT